MDAFTILLWLLRLGFVLLIYVFLYLVVRTMWQDLRAGVSGAGRPLGRLVVISAEEGRPAPGTAFALDAVNSIGRDVNNAIVVDDTFVSADHALLTFRGRAWYIEDRASTNGTWLNGQRVASLLPLGYGDELQIGQVRFRLERPRQTRFMTAATRALYAIGIRPHLRWRELGLLCVVTAALLVGLASLQSFRAGELQLGEADVLAVYLAFVFGIHVAFVITGRRMDQILFPTAALLAGISLLLMQRLPQELVVQTIAGRELGLAALQLVWIVVGFLFLAVLAIFVRSDGWLRRYKYTWAAVGIGLLLLVFLFGEVTGGARLTLRIGPFAGQPSELLKVILVVFLAGYLAENRALLASANTRVGPLKLPPLPYLLPMLAMWGLALAIVIVQRDLGAALLYFLVFLALLYVATRRASYVIFGVLLFLAGGAVLYTLFPHVQERIDIWFDPFADPQGAGYQIIRALYAYSRGGILGTGLGAGLPQVGTAPSVPLIQTDFIFAALAEEMGMLGALGVLGLYALVAQRGFRIAATAADDFRALLATGLTLVIVVQAAIIMGGNLRVVPLTGITLPLISYGGSSILVNGAVIGLLLALSDRGVEPPPPNQRPNVVRRIERRARGLGGGRLEAPYP